MSLGGQKEPFISVIIPTHNGRETIGRCLEAAMASRYENFEVIVVDDCSVDGSEEIIRTFPSRSIRLPEHGGASRARNTGARNARGEALFFTDADCVMREDTLTMAGRAFRARRDAAIGGTYTPMPCDRGFFSAFQSVFINYSETRLKEPDYIATHAMLIDRELFLLHGGFKEDFMPILEDVEFSHRLKRAGVRLVMEPDMMVRHIFDFSLTRSLRNAFRKSMYWTAYSLKNHDLLRDSGTASLELKANTLSWFLCLLLLLSYFALGSALPLAACLVAYGLNLAVNRRFIRALLRAGGLPFTLLAVLYYTTLYPPAVGAGGLTGAIRKNTGQMGSAQCTRP